jgi:hypothetical protein
MQGGRKTLGVSWLGGLVYGLSLTGVGVLMAGAGHGTYLLLGVASAPLSFLGIPFSMVSPPLLWSVMGGLLSYSHKSPQRQILLAALALHYLAILLLPFFEGYAEEKYIAKALEVNPVVVGLGVTLYLLGQVIIWLYWFRVETKINLP